MSKIAIITDVNAGLDYIGYDPQIPTLRSIINFGDEHFIDGIDIKANQFYERLSKDDSIIPSTSAPTVGEAMELLERLISEGYTDVIMYSISYKLSSIGQMVENLKEEYGDKINIYVIDTKAATYMQGFIAIEAKRLVGEGKTVQEILDYSNYLVENSHAYFVVKNLTYLVKNGRLSGAAGFMGNLLSIKPILELDKEGYIVSCEKIRTYKKAVDRALELFCNEIKDAKKVKLFVFHTLMEEPAKEIVEYIHEKFPTTEKPEIHMVTPAVGAHIGCGIIGMGYFILEH